MNKGLLLILACFVILGAIYSVVVPLFETPDEVWHFSFLQALATRKSLPVLSTQDPDMWLREAGQPPLYYLVAAPIVALMDTSDFPGFVRFNVAHPAVTAGSTSEAPNVFIHTPHEAFPYQGAVLAMHVVRLLSVLWGAGTVAGAYLLAREVLPGRPDLALAAAAITAFNPHFIFVSGAVNNDAAAACLCTLALWRAVRLVRAPTRKSALALGLVLGLALLSKMSALALLPLVALALGWTWWRDHDGRALLVRGGTVLGLAALVAGWWYVRNWALYGDPLAWDVWLENAGAQPIGPGELVRQLGQVAALFWSPYEGLFSAPVFWALGLTLGLSAAGWVRLFLRRDARPPASLNVTGLSLAGVWFGLLCVSLVRFMLSTPAATGRLLFPGIAALALLLVVGLEGAVPWRCSTTVMGGIGAGLFVLSLASPFCAIAPRFAPPLVDAVPGTASLPLEDATFDAVRLRGVQVDPGEARPGDTVDVTLYWEVLATPPADLRAVVRLWTLGGRLVGQRDTQPAAQVYPPDLWRSGDIVRDLYRLPVDVPGPAVCRVTVSLLAGDEPLGEVTSAPLLKLAAAPLDEIPHPVAYTLGEKVQLAGYDVTLSPAGQRLEVTLYWRPLAGMAADYVVFVHLLGSDGIIRGQGDGPPLTGDYPTTYWSPGETLADVHGVPLEGELTGRGYLLVGLYRRADGTRLPAYDATGARVPDDAIRLDILP